MVNREMLLEQLERLAIDLDMIIPQTAEIVRNAIFLLKESEKVVRCKDCLYYSGQFCNKIDVYPWPDNDWFCANGKSKLMEVERD